MIDKNQAVIDFLLTCPRIKDSPLYFNFINAKDNDKQIVTMGNDIDLYRQYVDGSVLRYYVFTLIEFKSISDMALVTMAGFSNENVDEMADVQALIDWVKEQEDNHNYPEFGEDFQIQKIQPMTDNPKLEGVNTEVSPMLAMYSVTIQIEYLDNSKVIWR